ncbi:MAG: FtsX-like permease family protein, partial [Actinomycetota bacterium]|nr:FtsX-like permease family protein [Actinomycetota bacterium]
VPTEAKYRIVGTVVMLAQDNKGLGHGALLTLDGLKRLNSYSGADVAWLRLAPGTDLRALARDIYPGEDMEVEEAYLDFDSLSLDLSRSGIGRVDSAPVVLAGLLGVLGLGVLLQLVVSATFRNRRPLAVLGVLGLGRAQVRSTVRWQAIAYTFLPVLFGVPVGVALGRTIFYGYASRLGAVPEPVTPVLAVVVLVPLAFALAIATALIPGWRAARRNAAAALRAE